MSNVLSLSFRCFFLFPFLACLWPVQSWFITPPTTKQDWQQLAALVVTTFDAPDSATSTRLELASWNLIERRLTEEATYRQYVSTAWKLKGAKYAIVVAKDSWGQVIGMVELGVNHRDGENRRATIGVLCVHEQYQKQGVGQALVTKCQELASKVWNEEFLFAEVEPSNTQAAAFFEACGFTNNDNKQVMVSLRGKGGRRLGERMHRLLSYSLEPAFRQPQDDRPP